MHGGEIFIPKIPSMKMTDLAKALAPHKIVGIRPGEKMHEVMITSDDRVVEFTDYYVITPTIQFNHIDDFTISATGEDIGIGFEYNSLNNTQWLSNDEFLEMVRKCNLFHTVNKILIKMILKL